jgi:hypothetical protein
MLPKRRSEKLLVRPLGDDVLVYDLARDRAHCLNPTAALVFELADGQTSIEAIAGVLGQRLGIDEAEPVVRLALDRLERARLLEKSSAGGGALGDRSSAWAGEPVSRRELLSKLKVAAVMLPAITSILAPTALDAATSLTAMGCTALTHPNCSGVMCSNVAGRCFRVTGMMTCLCQ